jgi:DNA/RNA endonuclease YhcR with UshA esterase domain
VDRQPPRRRSSAGGIHVSVKTQQETIGVHLGPAWYLKQQSLTIQPGDHVEVRGSRVTYRGHPAIIAAEVKRGSQSLKLRDDDGRPLWRGQRP